MLIRYSILILSFLTTTNLLRCKCDPKQYNQSNQSQFEHALKELPKLNLSGTEKILDIGSGDGFLSSYIAKNFLSRGHLVGIDNSHEMISFARSKSVNTNVDYFCMDACDYIALNEYDAIISFWTLHWVSDYEKVLNNISKSLKKGGYALLAHGVGIPLLQTIALKILDNEKWYAYKKDAQLLTYPSLSTIALAIEKAGLTVESLEIKKNGTWMLKDVIVKNWLSLSMFNFIPAESREQYCNEILEEFIRFYPVNDNNEIFRCSSVIVMLLSKKF